MRVLTYLELQGRLQRSGIGTAARHQRRAIRLASQESPDVDVALLETPWPAPRGMADGATLTDRLRAVIDSRSLIREFDLAHCNVIGPGSVAVARTARRRDVPLVVHAHVTSEDFAGSFRGSKTIAPVLRRYLRWFYSQADLVLVPSRHTKRRLEAYPVDAPVRPLSNGVDHESLADFEQFREAYRRRFDLDGTVVATVGNVFERKGLSEFCRLAESVQEDSDRYEFAWFGPYDTGPYASSEVTHWIGNPPENVTFTGWIDDKRGAFAAGDVFVFPTHEENQGIAVLEAMACGNPVVLRDLPVFREFYTDGQDCLLCDSHEEFLTAIRRLAADRALAERLGENARETAAEHSLERVGKELLEIYRDVIDDSAVGDGQSG